MPSTQQLQEKLQNASIVDYCTAFRDDVEMQFLQLATEFETDKNWEELNGKTNKQKLHASFEEKEEEIRVAKQSIIEKF